MKYFSYLINYNDYEKLIELIINHLPRPRPLTITCLVSYSILERLFYVLTLSTLTTSTSSLVIFPHLSISNLILSLKTTDLPFRNAKTAFSYINLALSPVILVFTHPVSSPTRQLAISSVSPFILLTDSNSTETTL